MSDIDMRTLLLEYGRATAPTSHEVTRVKTERQRRVMNAEQALKSFQEVMAIDSMACIRVRRRFHERNSDRAKTAWSSSLITVGLIAWLCILQTHFQTAIPQPVKEFAPLSRATSKPVASIRTVRIIGEGEVEMMSARRSIRRAESMLIACYRKMGSSGIFEIQIDVDHFGGVHQIKETGSKRLPQFFESCVWDAIVNSNHSTPFEMKKGLRAGTRDGRVGGTVRFLLGEMR